MFASLVIILPTVHQGGALVLRQDGEEHVFDADAMLAKTKPEQPYISYIVFYSDVEHEVLPVTSGYRVTLESPSPIISTSNTPKLRTGHLPPFLDMKILEIHSARY